MFLYRMNIAVIYIVKSIYYYSSMHRYGLTKGMFFANIMKNIKQQVSIIGEMSKMKDFAWLKLDTAAIMFAAIQDKNVSRVFRGSFVLKDENVDGEILKQAVYDVIERFPYFRVRYKSGFFWSHLQRTDIMPVVMEETEYPAYVQWYGKNGGPELRVLYYKRRISVEFAHMLTDGDGSSEFMKSLITRYYILKGDITKDDSDALMPGDEISEEEWENCYKKFYTGEKVAETKTEGVTHKLPMNPIDNYLKVVFGIMPVEDIIDIAHKYGASVTETLAAAEMLAMIKRSPEPINDVIRISIPINLRQFFPSDTLRNFAGDTILEFRPEGRTDITFEEIIKELAGVLKKRITKEYVQDFINKTYGKNINPVTRWVPYYVKHKVVNSSQKKDHRNSMSVILTNVGETELPPSLIDKIERCDSIPGNVTLYGLPITTSPVTHNGYMNLSFSINNKDTSFPKEFFRILSSLGVRVRIESTDDNGFDEATKNENGKRCLYCNVDLGEEYNICPLCGKPAVCADKKIHGFKTAEYPETFKHPDLSSKPVNVKYRSFKDKLNAYFDY